MTIAPIRTRKPLPEWARDANPESCAGAIIAQCNGDYPQAYGHIDGAKLLAGGWRAKNAATDHLKDIRWWIDRKKRDHDVEQCRIRERTEATKNRRLEVAARLVRAILPTLDDDERADMEYALHVLEFGNLERKKIVAEAMKEGDIEALDFQLAAEDGNAADCMARSDYHGMNHHAARAAYYARVIAGAENVS